MENLIKVATEKDQLVFLELDPNHSSVEHSWFKQSVERQDPFTSYYVWADGITNSDGGKERRSPPNNWVSHARIKFGMTARKKLAFNIFKQIYFIAECTW